MEDEYTKGIKNYETKEGTFIFFPESFAFKTKKVARKLEYAAYLSETNFEDLMIDYFLFREYENTNEFKLKIMERDLLAEYLDTRIKKFNRKEHLFNLIKKRAGNYDETKGIIVYLDFSLFFERSS